MRKELTFLMFLLMISASLGLTYTIDNVRNHALYGESFKYVINFSNEKNENVSVYINKIFLERTFPMSTVNPSINLEIPPYSSMNATLNVPLGDNLPRGLYWIPLLISYNNLTEQVFLEGEALSSNMDLRNLTVVPPLNATPLEEFKISIIALSNVEGLTPLIQVIISDDSRIIYNSTSLQVMNKGINVFERVIKLSNKTLAGNYKLLVQAELSGRIVTQGASNVTVSPYSRIDYAITKTEDLFSKQVIKEVSNQGTQAVTANLNYTLAIIEPALMTKALIFIKENGVTVNSLTPAVNDYVISQELTLNPGESAQLIVEFSYAGLLIAPFVILLSVIGWLLLTRRVVIRKEIIACKREDGELMVKVGISVKNISTNSVHDVKIIEDLPVYAKKAGAFGSIHGDIEKEKGTITFSPGRLDSREEIMLTYKFKTDVELEGRINLPPATVKYLVKNKLNITKSNTPTIELVKHA